MLLMLNFYKMENNVNLFTLSHSCAYVYLDTHMQTLQLHFEIQISINVPWDEV